MVASNSFNLERLLKVNINNFFEFAFVATGLTYGARQLGNLGQLALPSGSALASYSTTTAAIANRLLPISSVVLGGAALTVHFTGQGCKMERCREIPILGVWALSTGLAPLLPAHITPWMERAGRGFFAISSPINLYLFHRESTFKDLSGWLFSIAELAGVGLFSPLPGSQWVEPFAGLGTIASLMLFKVRPPSNSIGKAS